MDNPIDPTIKTQKELADMQRQTMLDIEDLSALAQRVCERVEHYRSLRYHTAGIDKTLQRTELGGESQLTMRLDAAEDQKWSDWGRDGLQTALMYLRRAVFGNPTF